MEGIILLITKVCKEIRKQGTFLPEYRRLSNGQMLAVEKNGTVVVRSPEEALEVFEKSKPITDDFADMVLKAKAEEYQILGECYEVHA
jgi:hypothetical protein